MNAMYGRTRELKQNLKLLAVTAAVLLGTVINPSNAFAGGVDGGGGNIFSGTPVPNSETMKYLVQDLRPVVKAHIDSLEIFRSLRTKEHHSEDIEWFNSALEKMFGNGTKKDRARVARLVNHLEIIIPSKGACADGSPDADITGEKQVDADASAFFLAPKVKLSPNQICLSFERISKKISYEQMQALLPALIVHELGHKFGWTEVESEPIQTLITRSTAADPNAKLQRNTREAIEAAKARKAVLDSVASVSTAKNDLVQTCAVIANARASIEGDVVNGYLRAAQDFLSPSGPEEILATTAAATQVGGLLMYCGLTYDMKSFKSSAPITMNIKDTFFKAYDYSFDFGYDLFDVMPKTGDAESLKAALLNVKNISAKIDAIIKNLSTPNTDKFKTITVTLVERENSH